MEHETVSKRSVFCWGEQKNRKTETITYPLKIDGWKIKFSFSNGPFSGDIREFPGWYFKAEQKHDRKMTANNIKPNHPWKVYQGSIRMYTLD